MYYNNILETIGNTPLVKLNKVVADVPALVLMKVETFNPGHSIKDRMALKMLEDAEERGDINPGGTIIECTSGNTGMGLAIAACVKGYRCIFTTSDKQSKEKMDLLRAFGAEVIVCPTNVEPDDPRSYYSVAERLSKEIPNSYWCNQYDNLSNRQAHYESTGPEIWEQTKGKITHMVVGVGTGGTISGTGRYLKEQNPDFLTVHYLETDQVQHRFWQFLPDEPNFRDGNPLTDGMLQLWRVMDDCVGRLVTAVSTDTVICIMSDHGFGPTRHQVWINNWLIENDFLVLK